MIMTVTEPTPPGTSVIQVLSFDQISVVVADDELQNPSGRVSVLIADVYDEASDFTMSIFIRQGLTDDKEQRVGSGRAFAATERVM